MSAATNAKINQLEERVAILETINRALITEMRSLAHNMKVIGEAIEAHDNMLAAGKAIAVRGGVTTEATIDSLIDEINEIRTRVVENRRRGIEVEEIEQRAKAASQAENGHPPEAFIFGG